MTYKTFLLALSLTCMVSPALHAAAPDITADAAVIMDGSDGRFLYEKNGTKREYPASMTKIMTCILSLERGNTYQTVTVSPRAADVESTALNGGEWLSLGDLRNQMMMISDNGAATAIAENTAGSLPSFADMMNQKAKDIGMTGTHFVNANGMPDENHYSTAEDMARLARYAMENRNFRSIVSTKKKQIRYIRPAEIFTCETAMNSSTPTPAPQASKPATPALPAAAWLPRPSGTIMNSSSSSCIPGIWTAGLQKRPNCWTTAFPS